jgi:tetratricopeptide (TPR) repeat protein
MRYGKNSAVRRNGSTLCAVAFLALAAPSRQPAQFEPANPVQLVVNVFIGSLQNPAAAQITVQLLDGFGSLENEQHTDSTGRVEFRTKTATKRVRIFGPGIEEHTEIVEIEAVERRKMVRIMVNAKTGAGGASTETGTLPAARMVSAARLTVPEKAQKEFRKGSEATEKKEWEKAKSHFEAAIALYPDFDVAYNGLGVALSALGDTKSARPAFEKAIKVNDGFAEAYRNLARIALAERDYQEVDNLLTRSLSTEATRLMRNCSYASSRTQFCTPARLTPYRMQDSRACTLLRDWLWKPITDRGKLSRNSGHI